MLDLILDHLWQSTLVVLAASVLALALRSQSAQVRYWIWFGASIKFLIPLSALVVLGAQFSWRTVESAPTESLRWQDVVIRAIQPMSAVDASDSITPMPGGSQTNAAPAGASPLTTPLPQTTPLPRADSPPPADPSTARDSDSLLAWISIAAIFAWALGTLIIAAAWSRRWLWLRRLARQAEPFKPDIREANGIEIRTIDANVEPGVYGIFRPLLLLPEGIVERLSPPQLAAIVRHERCHVERRDNLTAVVKMIVAAVFWFHPLVWWIGSRLIAERERACDEAVIAAGFEPSTYARGILEVCSFYLDSPLPCASGVGGGSLKQRVRRISDNRPTRALGKLAKALLISLPGTCLLAPFFIGLSTPTQAFAQATDTQVSNRLVEDFLARRAYFDELGPLIGGPTSENSETQFAMRLTVCEQLTPATTSSEADDSGPTPEIASIQDLIAYAFDVESDQVGLPADLQTISLVTAAREEDRFDHEICRAAVRRSLQDDYGLIASIAPDGNSVQVGSLDWPGPLPDPVALTTPGLAIDSQVLDGYTGHFARPNTESTFLAPVFEVRREGQMLLIDWNGERIELAATSQTEFSAPEYLLPIFRERYVSLGRSERPIIYGQVVLEDGRNFRVELDQPMYEFRFDSNDELRIFNDAEKRKLLDEPVGFARRIDTNDAEATLAGLARRRAENLPDPATESLLETLLESLSTGEAGADSRAASAARQMRDQLERIEPGFVNRLGAPRQVSLREVLPSGRDVYDVVFDWMAFRITIGMDSTGQAVPIAVNIDCRRESASHIERYGGCSAR